MAQLRLELLREEAQELSVPGAQNQAAAGMFFRKAFSIEDRWYISVFTLQLQTLMGSTGVYLARKRKGKVTTAHSHAKLLQLRNVLSRDLIELRKAQRIFMPGLMLLLESDGDQEEPKLWLPSELSDADREEWCLPGIPELEFCFRYAQADDSLAKIRRVRRMVQGLLDQNSKHPNPQRTVTRTKSVFDGFQVRIRRAAKQYQHARSAMQALDHSERLNPRWARRFKELEDADIRGPGRESYEKSEGKFQPSRIWLVPHLPSPGSAELEVDDAMRGHWAKCQAQAERYEEEVMLTVEEMGRTLQYFEWKKLQWLSLQSDREKSANPPSIWVSQGLRAYARCQAHVYTSLITSYAHRWRGLLTTHRLGSHWLCRYPITHDPSSTQTSRGAFRRKPDTDATRVDSPFVQASSSPLTSPPDADTGVEPPAEDDSPPNADVGVKPLAEDDCTLDADAGVEPPMEDSSESDSGDDYDDDEEAESDFDD